MCFHNRVSATSEKPEDLLRKASIALKRKEKENLEQHLRGLQERKAGLQTQVQERRTKVEELLGKLNGVDSTLK